MKKITKIWYNFAQYNDGNEAGETYETHAVGAKGVIEIDEHTSYGEGDKYFFYVRFDNDNEEKIFNPNRVFYEPVESNLHPIFETIANAIKPV